MPNYVTMSLDDLHEETTSAKLLAVTTRSIVGGVYRGKATKVFLRASDSGIPELDGRPHVRLALELYPYQRDGVDVPRKVGSVFLTASWVEKYSSSGALDKYARKWGQLVRAVGMGAKHTIPEVIHELQEREIGVFVKELFKPMVQEIPDPSERAYQLSRGLGEYEEGLVFLRGDEMVVHEGVEMLARMYYLGLGLDSTPFVQSVFMLRD